MTTPTLTATRWRALMGAEIIHKAAAQAVFTARTGVR